MTENTHNGFEYVDLGLPSGTLWATCNVGAKNPEESGLYFQWGDTVGYYEGEGAEEHSTFETTPFNNGNADFDEKSILISQNRALNIDVLRKAFDAAHVHMGGNWRMPTKEEFDELRQHTSSDFIRNYKSSGINGTLLTSKMNGKTMFIPASGNFSYGELRGDGKYGYLFSSSFDLSNHRLAYGASFSKCFLFLSPYYRFYGFQVRGVF